MTRGTVPDPVPAPAGRRVLSAGADLCLALVLTRLLASSTGIWLAERSVPMLHIGSADTLWRGPVPMALALTGPLVYGFPLAWLLLAVAGPLGGASAGQLLTGLQVVSRAERHAARGRIVRELVRSTPAWLLLTGLLLGSWPWALASIVVLGGVAAGWTPVLLGRRALHDRLAGTEVVRRPVDPAATPVSGPRRDRVR